MGSHHIGKPCFVLKIKHLSPWSDSDWPVAPNPDLAIKTDDEGNVLPWKRLVPGEHGYRMEAVIIIGESYWQSKSLAEHGDTFGISVSNVMSHSRVAIWLNHTLLDSSFDNIRVFGNGYSAVFFGAGTMENLRFTNISYDKNCTPLKEDRHIRIDWNNTKADGLSCVYFNGTSLKNVYFRDMFCLDKMDSVFGGHGSGSIVLSDIKNTEKIEFSTADGIEIIKK